MLLYTQAERNLHTALGGIGGGEYRVKAVRIATSLVGHREDWVRVEGEVFRGQEVEALALATKLNVESTTGEMYHVELYRM